MLKEFFNFLIVYMGINSCSRKVCFIFVNNRVLSSWKLFIKNNTNFKGCLYESIGFKPLIVLMYLKRAVNFNQYWTKDYLNSRPKCSFERVVSRQVQGGCLQKGPYLLSFCWNLNMKITPKLWNWTNNSFIYTSLLSYDLFSDA